MSHIETVVVILAVIGAVGVSLRLIIGTHKERADLARARSRMMNTHR